MKDNHINKVVAQHDDVVGSLIIRFGSYDSTDTYNRSNPDFLFVKNVSKLIQQQCYEWADF